MNNKNTSSNTYRLVVLGVLAAILLIMANTPLGYLNVGPLSISLNMIPVAIGAVATGPVGGAILGGVFGLTSFLKSMGVGGGSPFGMMLFSINPFYSAVLAFVPRILDGYLIGLIFKLVRKLANTHAACFVTGFCAAALNTVFYMSTLILLYGNTEYLSEIIAGRNIFVFVCAFVGINAVTEIIASTLVTGLVGFALHKARLLDRD